MEYTPQKDMFNRRRGQIFSMYNNADEILNKSKDEETDIEKSESVENQNTEEVFQELDSIVEDVEKSEEQENDIEKAFDNLFFPILGKVEEGGE